MASADAAKLLEELKHFEQVVSGVLNPDNAVRQAAEAAHARVRDGNLDKYYFLLVQLLAQSRLPEVRQFCGVVLRQNLTKAAKSWASITANTQNMVKKVLLELFKVEQNRTIRRKVSDAIGTLAGRILLAGGWPELMPLLTEVSQSPHALHRESVLDILDKLAEYAVAVLQPHLPALKKMFAAGLADEKNPTVQLAAMRACVSLILSLEDKERAFFVDISTLLFAGTVTAFKAKDDDRLKDHGEVLVNLVRIQPTFLRTTLKAVIATVVPIVQCKALEDDTRRVFFEFLLTLMEKGKGMVRKVKEFPAAMIPTALQMLIEVPADHTEWQKDLEQKDEDADEYQSYQMGLEAIDRMAMSLGEKVFMETAFPLVNKALSNPAPLTRHAGLMCLGEMAEGCCKALKPHLPKLIDIVVPMAASDPHPRVRWAAMNCLAQFATDYRGHFTKNYHARCMPIYLAALNPSQPPRLLRHALMGIIDFCAWADSEHITPYLDVGLPLLVKVLQINDHRMQEAALQTLSSVALLAEGQFTKWYDALMPGLKQLFVSAREKTQRELRAKCMECIGIVGKAVGKEKFLKDAREVMDLLMKQNAAGYQADDPCAITFVQTASRICQAIGDDFLPYLPHIIPGLIKSSQLENAVVMYAEGEPNPVEHEDGYKTVPYEIRNVGTRYVAVNGALLEEKTTACHMLYQYSEQLREGFFPWVEPVSRALVPMIRFLYHETVRISCISALPTLVMSAHLHFKKANEPEKGRAYVRNLWEFMFKPYCEAIQLEINMESLNGILDSLSDVLAILDFPLPKEQVDTLNELMAELVKLSEERRAKRELRKRSADFDDEEQVNINLENSAEDDFLSYVFLVNSKLARCCKEEYVPSFHRIMFPWWAPMLAENKSVGQRNAAMCSIDDVIQFCGKPALLYVDKFYPIVLKDCRHADVDIRQSAVFGVGACAAAAGAPFIPAIPSALNVLYAVVEDKDSRVDENEPATDNAISSIGKIMLHFPQVLMPLPPGAVADAKTRPDIRAEHQLPRLLPTWLHWLPCVGDEEEAGVVHNQLCQFLERPAYLPLLMGQNNVNLPKVVGVVADIVDTNLILDDTQTRLLAIVNKIFATLPPAAKQKLWSLLQDRQRNRILPHLQPQAIAGAGIGPAAGAAGAAGAGAGAGAGAVAAGATSPTR